MSTRDCCELCEDAFRGLIEQKLELEERLRQMTANHDGTLRLMAKFQSRALKAESDLQAIQGADQ
jgi:hypothetical protein